MLFADERLARNGKERIEDRRLNDPTAAKLPLDHRLALTSEVCHGRRHVFHLGNETRKRRTPFRCKI